MINGRNAVTFAVYLCDGRLLLQHRGFFSPEGRPVSSAGLLSINGGGMETDGIVEELLREMKEELGIEFVHEDVGRRITYLGDVLDEATGRTCHVHKLETGYDELLEGLPAREIVRLMLEPEGIGRAAVWRGDVEMLKAEGRLTPISVAILDALPSLLPPEQPIVR